MRILVFLHGTILMHSTGAGKTRQECVQQVVEEDPSVALYESYIPIGNAVEKLRGWQRQGAEIAYLSSRRGKEKIEIDRGVLQRFGFPKGEILFRKIGEKYADVVERIMPDLLIEDDCESIAGEVEMISPHLQGKAKEKIDVIVVKEFGGIDHLPHSYEEIHRLNG